MISKTDKIAITGATGFLGSYILRYFWKQGYHNIHASRRAGSSLDLIGKLADKVIWHEADVLDVSQMGELIDDASLVIHAAAMVSYQKKHRELMLKTNVEGTANVVNICIEKNVKKLLYISSIAALGKDELGNTISEQQEWEDNDSNTDYAVSKYHAELEVWRGKEEGLDVAMINPGVVLGAGRWSDSSLAIVKTVADNVKFYPLGSNGFVDVRDVAKMTFALLENDISGERFIAVSGSVKIKELIWNIADRIKSKRASIEVRPWMIPGIAMLAKVWSWIRFADPFITRATLDSTANDWKYNNQKSIDKLGITYISIEQSIADMCDAYNESVKLNRDFGLLEI